MVEAIDIGAGQGARSVAAPDAADAFAGWLRPHLPVLAVVAEREVGRADRDDVVQETLIRAWRRRHTYDGRRGSPRAWLLAVLFDQARRHRVRHPWSARLPEGERARPDPGAPPDLAGNVDLDRAVRRLPRRQRQVVMLYYLADLPVAEVAAALRITEGSVKSHLHDARAALRTALGSE